MAATLLAFAGALRKDSLNRKLCAVAVQSARARGAEVDLLDLREVPMPLYDGDLEKESGLPREALELRRRVARAGGVLIVSPEYNFSIPGTLKNAIDWSSRPPDQPWKGKVIALMAASPGAYGGARMIPDLTKVLMGLGGIVLPGALTLGRADKAFDADGALVEPATAKIVDGIVERLISATAKLS
jgi:chromate reductase, NAD(P)H dehydrogenase (quinone)